RALAPERCRSRLRRLADGARGRGGQIRELDRPTGAGDQQPAARLRVRARQLSWRAMTNKSAVVPTGEPPRQQLIDPEICIRCNTCEETCPTKAVSHDTRNYVVDASLCNFCNDCISPCPTGAIDNWRMVDRAKPYTLAEQLSWDSLPAETPV